MIITFGPVTSIQYIAEDGPRDLTPYVSDVRIELEYPDEPEIAWPLETRKTVSWSGKVDIQRWFWRRLTGKAHPRIRRMHSRYPRRWRRKR